MRSPSLECLGIVILICHPQMTEESQCSHEDLRAAGLRIVPVIPVVHLEVNELLPLLQRDTKM